MHGSRKLRKSTKLSHTEACPAHNRREQSYGHELSAAIRRQRRCAVNIQGFLRPATAFAATAKDYPSISLRTSSWKPPQLEGNFRWACPEISLPALIRDDQNHQPTYQQHIAATTRRTPMLSSSSSSSSTLSKGNFLIPSHFSSD